MAPTPTATPPDSDADLPSILLAAKHRKKRLEKRRTELLAAQAEATAPNSRERGRPCNKPGERASETLSLRLTPSDLLALLDEAEKLNLPISQVAVTKLTGRSLEPQIQLVEVPSTYDAEVGRSLQSCGGLLNQADRALNTMSYYGRIDPDAFGKVALQLDAIRNELSRLATPIRPVAKVIPGVFRGVFGWFRRNA